MLVHLLEVRAPRLTDAKANGGNAARFPHLLQLHCRNEQAVARRTLNSPSTAIECAILRVNF